MLISIFSSNLRTKASLTMKAKEKVMKKEKTKGILPSFLMSKAATLEMLTSSLRRAL